MSTVPTVTVTLTDLQALTDVTEGFMSEAGEYAVSRYADPVEVEEAVANAKTTIRNAMQRFGPIKPELSPFQAWQRERRLPERLVDFYEDATALVAADAS